MEGQFDPYHKWLGIQPKDQPPHHYRLLGIDLFEGDLEAIRTCAERQASHLRTFVQTPQAAVAQQLLREVASARICLLDPKTKRAYDDGLRAALQINASRAAPAAAVVADIALSMPAEAASTWVESTRALAEAPRTQPEALQAPIAASRELTGVSRVATEAEIAEHSAAAAEPAEAVESFEIGNAPSDGGFSGLSFIGAKTEVAGDTAIVDEQSVEPAAAAVATESAAEETPARAARRKAAAEPAAADDAAAASGKTSRRKKGEPKGPKLWFGLGLHGQYAVIGGGVGLIILMIIGSQFLPGRSSRSTKSSFSKSFNETNRFPDLPKFAPPPSRPSSSAKPTSRPTSKPTTKTVSKPTSKPTSTSKPPTKPAAKPTTKKTK